MRDNLTATYIHTCSNIPITGTGVLKDPSQGHVLGDIPITCLERGTDTCFTGRGVYTYMLGDIHTCLETYIHAWRHTYKLRRSHTYMLGDIHTPSPSAGCFNDSVSLWLILLNPCPCMSGYVKTLCMYVCMRKHVCMYVYGLWKYPPSQISKNWK